MKSPIKILFTAIFLFFMAFIGLVVLIMLFWNPILKGRVPAPASVTHFMGALNSPNDLRLPVLVKKLPLEDSSYSFEEQVKFKYVGIYSVSLDTKCFDFNNSDESLKTIPVVQVELADTTTGKKITAQNEAGHYSRFYHCGPNTEGKSSLVLNYVEVPRQFIGKEIRVKIKFEYSDEFVKIFEPSQLILVKSIDL